VPAAVVDKGLKIGGNKKGNARGRCFFFMKEIKILKIPNSKIQ
jgi:hypothetical protein